MIYDSAFVHGFTASTVSMRVISLNVNGIRSAARKGFYTWLARQQADLVCLQEVRAQRAQLTDIQYFPAPYHCFYHEAERPGYSGVALYSRRQPDTVRYGFGWPEIDAEARYLELRFGELRVSSLYLPSGSSGEERQQFKFALMERLGNWLGEQAAAPGEFLCCGDWNIAHRELDLKNWRGNQKNSGFLPEERAWLDQVFGPLGLVDVYRQRHPEREQYTWWSNRGQAWAKNVGWRIDYQVATSGLASQVLEAEVYTEERFSDHAPLTMDYQLID